MRRVQILPNLQHDSKESQGVDNEHYHKERNAFCKEFESVGFGVQNVPQILPSEGAVVCSNCEAKYRLVLGSWDARQAVVEILVLNADYLGSHIEK